MGDRGQVKIWDSTYKDEAVWLYTHWGASELVETVHEALSKKWRWDDYEYLARIIFCEMIHGDEDGETGFGIGTSKHMDIWRVVEIDCGTQRIKVVDNDAVRLDSTFEDFIALSREQLELASELSD